MREKVGVVEIKSKYLLPYIGKTAKVLVLQMTDLEENNYKEKLKKSMNRQRVTLKIGKGKK